MNKDTINLFDLWIKNFDEAKDFFDSVKEGDMDKIKKAKKKWHKGFIDSFYLVIKHCENKNQ